MKPLLGVVAICLLLSTNALPENIEDVKALPQTEDIALEAEASEPLVRAERCTTCNPGVKLNLKSPNEILAQLHALPGGEVHTQQSFEECSSEKGCAGIKVKDGKVVERFGNVDAFKAAAAAGSGSDFTFHAAGKLGNVFEGGIPNGGPFWWMNENSPFKQAGGNVQKFSQSSSSYSTSGAAGNAGAGNGGASFSGSLDLSGNPFLNGELSKDLTKLAGGFAGAGAEVKPATTFQSSSFESSSYNSGSKGELDLSKNPFLNGANKFGSSGFQAQDGFQGNQAGAGSSGQGFGSGQFGQGQSGGYSSSSKFSSSGYTGSSPSPFTASTAGSNVNLIQNSQKNSEFDFVEQQQQQQNIDEAFQGTGNVHAHEHSGGDLQQTCAGQGYVCVHKAQCNNGVVNTNGAGILQAKTKKQYCNIKTEICCRIEISTLQGAGGLQGSLGVGSATFSGGNQGSGLFVSSSEGAGASQGGSFGASGSGASQGGSFGASGSSSSQGASFGASGSSSSQGGSFGASGSGSSQRGSFGASGSGSNQGGSFGASGSGATGSGGIGSSSTFESSSSTFESSSRGGAGQAGQGNQGSQGSQGSQGFGVSGSFGSGSNTNNGAGSFGATGSGNRGVTIESSSSSFESRGTTFGNKGGNGAAGGANKFGATGSGSSFGSGTNKFGATGSGSSFGSGTNKFGATASESSFGSGSTNFGVGVGSTNAPKGFGSTTGNEVVYKQTSQSNFIETDSFSAGSENAGVFRPGSTGAGLKPGVPYLPPVDSSNSGSGIISSTLSPRPATTPKPYYPTTSTAAPGYLPPQIPEQSINTETRVPNPNYNEGSIILDETRRPKQPPVGPGVGDIPAGCAAALKCTPIEYCTAEGVISNTTVVLTKDQDAYRVPLTDCKNLETGTVGKCCRDPFYTDPWPANQLGQWVPGVFGGNDGKYNPDSRGSGSIVRPSTQRPPVTGSTLLNNIRAPKPTFSPFGPNQVTPGFPSSTASSFAQKGQFEVRGEGQFGQGGQGQYTQGGAGQIGVAGQGGQFSQGGTSQSQFTSSSSQTYTSGSTQLGANRGQGQAVVQGQGQAVGQGQGQAVGQGQGQTVIQGQGQYSQSGKVQFGQGGAGQLTQGGSGQFAQGGAGQFAQGGAGQFAQGGAGLSAQAGAGQFGQSGAGKFGQGGAGQFAQGGTGQFAQGGAGQSAQAGAGQFAQGGAGQSGQGGSGQFAQGGAGQFGQGGVGQFAQGGSGQFAQGGAGQFAQGGAGQIELQGQGVQGQFTQTSQTSKFGQTVTQGQRGQGQAVITGQGQTVDQGFGQGVRQGQGFGVSQGSGFNVENEYSESTQRVFLQQFSAGGQCGQLNGQKPYGNRNELEVDFAEIPWQAMVLLQTNRSLLCGGVITRPDVVVTSASCVDGLEAKNVLIKGGEWKLGIDDEPLPYQIVHVKNILRHPYYKAGSLINDVAILVLPENLRWTKNIYPICLPRAGETLDAYYNGAGECIVTGWGKQVLQAHLSGAIMHSLNVSLINPGECQAKLSQEYPHLLEQYDQDSCACGQPTNPTNNICKVDVGSALACTTGDGHFVLRGIYSWDSGCQPGNQLAAFYKFDLEWYEWAIGLIESTKYAQFSSGSQVLSQNRYNSQITSGSKGGYSGVKGGVKGQFGQGQVQFGQGQLSQGQFGKGQGQFGQGQSQISSQFTSGQSKFGSQGQFGSGQFASGGQGQIGSQFGTGKGQFGSGSQGQIVGQFGAGKGQFESGSQGQIVGQFGAGQGQFGSGKYQFSQSSAQSGGSGAFGAEIKGPVSNTFSATYSEKKVYQSEPKIVTFTTKPEIVTFTTKPEYFTYTTKPKLVTYTTKPQIIRYETSGSGTNPQYIAPGVTFNPSFTDVVGQHTHNAQCKCDGKK